MKHHSDDQIRIQNLVVKPIPMPETDVITGVNFSFLIATGEEGWQDVRDMIDSVLDGHPNKLAEHVLPGNRQLWVGNHMTRPKVFESKKNLSLATSFSAEDICPKDVKKLTSVSEFKSGCFRYSNPDGKRLSALRNILIIYQVPGSDWPHKYHFAYGDVVFGDLHVGRNSNLQYSPAVTINEGRFAGLYELEAVRPSMR